MQDIPIEKVIEALRRASDWHRLNGGHDDRVQDLCLEIGRALELDEQDMEYLKYSSMLHDVGRVGIDNDIISKPGKLTKSQMASMREHSQIGYDLVTGILPVRVCEAILHHHEHWDGTGYPKGLSGEAIPLLARIIAPADEWDALTTDRPYRKALVFEDALHTMNLEASYFDPKIYAVFLDVLREMR
jgi:HD-GYP domain-containing protein (c-di-GMP phosphodiesterase class II)